MLGDAARTWEMLEKIALIDPEVWDQGPNVVNPIVEGIWTRYQLLEEAERLKADIAAAVLRGGGVDCF